MADPQQAFGPCRNPACDHKVRVGFLYCCAGCSAAHEMGADPGEPGETPNDMLGHNAMCAARHEVRGPWTGARNGTELGEWAGLWPTEFQNLFGLKGV